jgi:photosystem II stability/assembly factor-like uncharacterized protein
MKKRSNKALLCLFILGLLCMVAVESGTASQTKNWERIDYGLETGYYTKLVINPDNHSVLYLSTKGGGVFKSHNGGQEWVPINQGLENLEIDWVVMDPNDSEILYVNNGLITYKTINGGQFWEKVRVNELNYLEDEIQYLEISPVNTQILYAYNYFDYSFFRSMDGGKSWRDISDNFVQGENNDFAIDPNQDNNIYLTKNVTLYHSPDYGDTWAAISANSQCLAWTVAVNPHNSDVYIADLAGKICKKTAGSEQWEVISSYTGFAPALHIVFDPNNPDIIYVATQTKVYKSLDLGLTWNEITHGLIGSDPYSFTVDPVDSETLYLTNLGNVLKSIDGGENWSVVNSNLRASYINTITFDPLNSSVIYVGTPINGVFKSVDGGQNWNRASNGIANDRVSALAIAESNTNTLFAASYNYPIGYFYKSTDGAISWSQVYERRWWEVSSLLVHPENPTIIYAATTNALYKSLDSGLVWSQLPIDLEAGTLSGKLMFSPSDPNILYYIGIKAYRSMDQGESWTEIGPIGQIMIDLYIDPNEPDLIYALSSNAFFRSQNGGTDWQRMSEAYQFSSASDLAVLPGDSYRFFVVTNSGVYLSSDEGITWNLENGRLPVGFTQILEADVVNGVVFAGTGGKGVYRWPGKTEMEVNLPMIFR